MKKSTQEIVRRTHGRDTADTDPVAAGIQADADANGNPLGAAGAYEDILIGSAGNDHSRALTAFAMQKYYDETQASAGYNKTLFTGVAGGIQFDIKDVASTPSAAKGYADFRLFLEQYYTTIAPDGAGGFYPVTSPDKNQILAALSSLRDWYIQAGADAMNATDTLNRNAFMFGDTGNAANDSDWRVAA